MTTYFIRNDDVGPLTDSLRRYVDLFLQAELPVSYQVIPASFTDECANWLRALQRDHPDLIEFGQHGLRHEMMVRGKKLWREFGPERSFEDQNADIALGRSILLEKLGPAFSGVLFTPPQHKYDRNTLKALKANGFSAVSGAHYASLHHQLAYKVGRSFGLTSIRHHGISRHGTVRDDVAIADISISVAIDNGGAVTCPAPECAPAAARARRTTKIVGFMTHHELYGRSAFDDQLGPISAALSTIGKENFGLAGVLATRFTQ